MMWDIGGHGIPNTTSDRNRSRSPQPPHMRMPSPSFPIPTNYSQGNASTGSPFNISMGSPYSPVAASASYDSYVYPSMSRAPSPFLPNKVVHVIHHSKHHSSSKNKHNDHNKHSGHGHSHSHPRRIPSPSPMLPFPISPSTSFPTPSPHIQFPAVPHHPTIRSSSSHALLKVPPPSPHVHFTAAPHHRSPIRSSSSNVLFNAASPSHNYLKPPPKQSTKHTHKLTKHNPSPVVPLNPDFQYSKCTGRRRALCIGINYRGQENELRGCINDAKNVRRFLMKNNYKNSEIMILTDEKNDPHRLPTYNNIIEAMHWLVRGAKPNDSLFLHYSGHGGQTRDLDGDEADGWDEVIYPLDYKRKGHILDDLMHDIMVKPLPRGCRLTGLFDACHSGSVLDLPFDYSAHGRLKSSPITPGAQASKASSADVISWSACPDSQTSADTFSGGVAVGAMSNAFVEVLTNKPEQTYQELLRSIRLTLHPRYRQIPQLGSSHQIDTNLRFIF